MSQASLSPPSVPPPDDDETFYEVVDGQRVETPPMAAFETMLATKLALFIGAFLRTNSVGQIAVEMLFLIDSDRDLQRRPDVAYVSRERWPLEQELPPSNAWSVVPDLVVEVISQSNTATDVLIKIDEYFRSDVRLVWVIFPVQEKCYVYESPSSVRILKRGDMLDGGAVLPGFQLAFAELLRKDGRVGG